jgi:hypothetical protein
MENLPIRVVFGTVVGEGKLVDIQQRGARAGAAELEAVVVVLVVRPEAERFLQAHRAVKEGRQRNAIARADLVAAADEIHIGRDDAARVGVAAEDRQRVAPREGDDPTAGVGAQRRAITAGGVLVIELLAEP